MTFMNTPITRDFLFRMIGSELDPNVENHNYDELSLCGRLGGDSDWNHMLTTVYHSNKEVGQFWMDFEYPPFRIELFITPTLLWEVERYMDIMEQLAARGRRFRSEGKL